MERDRIQESANLRASPCSAGKAPRAVAPAGGSYVGTYHRMARRAAEALTRNGGLVLVLSARCGLVRLDQEIEHYELTVGEPGTVATSALRRQAAVPEVARATVTILAGRAYAQLALLGTRGIGEERAIIQKGMNS